MLYSRPIQLSDFLNSSWHGTTPFRLKSFLLFSQGLLNTMLFFSRMLCFSSKSGGGLWFLMQSPSSIASAVRLQIANQAPNTLQHSRLYRVTRASCDSPLRCDRVTIQSDVVAGRGTEWVNRALTGQLSLKRDYFYL